MATARQTAEAIFRAALQAVEPAALVRRHLGRNGSRLHIAGGVFDLAQLTGIYVVGAGKAALPMARATEEILGDALTAGAVTTKYGHGGVLDRIRLTEAAHPVPDAAGLLGTARIQAVLAGRLPTDLVLVLLSGGGSALLTDVPPGCTLAHIQACFTELLHCGADIAEMNAVRKHLSGVKGGQLARLAQPARVVSLLLSDVPGDEPAVIASGPTAPDPTTFAQAWAVVRKYGLENRLPAPVVRHLQAGCRGTHAETPKPGDPLFARVANHLVGSNRLALQHARQYAESLGFQTEIRAEPLAGEAREAAMRLVRQAEARADGTPRCLLAGGETTVTVRGKGRGGRNQELALAAALALAGVPGITLLAAGTDGTDGPTDATGAVVDARTVAQARALGLDAAACLHANDAYAFFKQAGGHLVTGPTGTNVMDLAVVLTDVPPG